MGTYRSVFCSMTCERCAARYRAEVQFKTDDDWQEEYEDGQKIPPTDGLAPGDGFDGVAERFCPNCERQWDAAHKGAMFEALAGYVAEGRLIMNYKPGKPPLTAEELRNHGQEAVVAIRSAADRGRKAFLTFGEITWEGVAGGAMNEIFTRTLHADVTRALVSAGWPHGRDSLRDLRVRIGHDMTISVGAEDGEDGC